MPVQPDAVAGRATRRSRAPSSLTRATTLAPVAARRDVDLAGAGVAGDVGKALLHDAVDGDLLLGAERRRARSASRSSARRHAGLALEVADLASAAAATSPWSSSAAGRSSRAIRSSSSIACVAALLRLAQLVAQLRRAPAAPSPARRSSTPVSAWLASSWRSRAMRARSVSCARITALGGLRSARPAGGRACGRRRGAGERPRASRPSAARALPPGCCEVDGLHRADQALQRLEAATQHEPVDEHRREQRRGQQQQAALVSPSTSWCRTSSVAARTVAAISDGVDAEHLGQQRGPRERRLAGRRGYAASALGSGPHIGGGGGRRYPQCNHLQNSATAPLPPADRKSAHPPRMGALSFSAACPRPVAYDPGCGGPRASLYFLKCQIPIRFRWFHGDQRLRLRHLRLRVPAPRQGARSRRSTRPRSPRSSARACRSSTSARPRSSSRASSPAPRTSRAATSRRGSTASSATARSA